MVQRVLQDESWPAFNSCGQAQRLLAGIYILFQIPYLPAQSCRHLSWTYFFFDISVPFSFTLIHIYSLNDISGSPPRGSSISSLQDWTLSFGTWPGYGPASTPCWQDWTSPAPSGRRGPLRASLHTWSAPTPRRNGRRSRRPLGPGTGGAQHTLPDIPRSWSLNRQQLLFAPTCQKFRK